MVDKDDLVVIVAVTLAVALPTIFLLIGLICMRLNNICEDNASSIGSNESEGGETHVRQESSVTRSNTYWTTSPRTSTQGLDLTYQRWVRPVPRVTNDGEHISGPNGSAPTGLDESTIDSYPTAPFGARISESVDGSCPICLEKYSCDDIVRRLPCTHPFHVECIDPWLRIKALCPLCKERLFRNSSIIP